MRIILCHILPCTMLFSCSSPSTIQEESIRNAIQLDGISFMPPSDWAMHIEAQGLVLHPEQSAENADTARAATTITVQRFAKPLGGMHKHVRHTNLPEWKLQDFEPLWVTGRPAAYYRATFTHLEVPTARLGLCVDLGGTYLELYLTGPLSVIDDNLPTFHELWRTLMVDCVSDEC